MRDYNPRQLAEEFAKLGLSGPELDIGVTRQRPIYPEKTFRDYIGKVERALEPTRVTDECRTYAANLILNYWGKRGWAVGEIPHMPENDARRRLLVPLLEATGTQEDLEGLLKEVAGINLQNGEYGIFDPLKAQEQEICLLQGFRSKIKTEYDTLAQAREMLADPDLDERGKEFAQGMIDSLSERNQRLYASDPKTGEDLFDESGNAITTITPMDHLINWVEQYTELYGTAPPS